MSYYLVHNDPVVVVSRANEARHVGVIGILVYRHSRRETLLFGRAPEKITLERSIEEGIKLSDFVSRMRWICFIGGVGRQARLYDITAGRVAFSCRALLSFAHSLYTYFQLYVRGLKRQCVGMSNVSHRSQAQARTPKNRAQYRLRGRNPCRVGSSLPATPSYPKRSRCRYRS